MTSEARHHVERFIDRIRSTPPKPFFLKVTPTADGNFSFQQLEFLTVEQAAELAHVDRRTLYLWVEKAATNGLKFYRAPETRNILFDMQEFIDWIKGARKSGVESLESGVL